MGKGMTNTFGQKAFNKPGAARFEVYDDYTASWIYFGRTSGQTFRPNFETIKQSASVDGVMQDYQERVTKQTGDLGITFAEFLDPKVLQFTLGDRGAAQTKTASDVYSSRYNLWLYGTEEQFVGNKFAIANYANLGSPTCTVTPAGGGGSFGSGSARNYYFWAQAVWGTVPTGYDGFDQTTTAGHDVSFVASAPSDAIAGTAGYQGKSVAATGSTTMNVTLVAPTGVPTPDGYIVWASLTNDITTANLVGYGSSTSIVCLDPHPSGSDTYAASTGAAFLKVSTYASSPTYVLLSQSTDVTWDSTRGTVKRVSTGTLDSGQNIVAIVWNIWPAKINTKIASASDTQDYRKVRLVFLEEEVDSTDTPVLAEGGILTFDRVNVAALAPNIGFNETDFPDGWDVTATCLYDTTTGEVGTVDSYSAKFTNWAQNYL